MLQGIISHKPLGSMCLLTSAQAAASLGQGGVDRQVAAFGGHDASATKKAYHVISLTYNYNL